MRAKSLILSGILTYLFLSLVPSPIFSIYMPDFRVNSDTGYVNDWGSRLAFDKYGNFVVVWNDRGPNSENRQIYFQCFDSLANRVGDRVLVSDSTNHRNSEPCIAMHPSGRFVVCWTNFINIGCADPKLCRLFDVWVQGFDSEGRPAWPRQQVDVDRPESALVEWMPSIAMDKNGNFIVVWATQNPDQTRDIYAQRFSSAGERIGSNFEVREAPLSSQFPDVAFNSLGYFFIGWQGYTYCPGITYEYVLARIFNPAGEPITPELLIASRCAHNKWKGGNVPAIASNSQNNFVVAFNGFDTLGTYPNNAIVVQTFDTLGNPVDTATVGSDAIDLGDILFQPRIAVDSADGYVIVWPDLRNYTSWNLWAQRFNSSGQPQGANYRINMTPGTVYTYYMEDVAIHGNTVGISWADNRDYSHNKADIYAKLLDLDKIGYYYRGDLNLDGAVSVGDIIYLINYLFRNGWGILPEWTGDANSDGKITVSDVVYLVNYLFKGGPPPAS